MTVEYYNSDIRGVLHVAPNNVMSAKYNIIAVNDSELVCGLTVGTKTTNDLQSTLTPRLFRERDIKSHFNVMYRGNSDIHANIQAFESNFLHASLEVRPHGTMVGIFDIIEPLRVTDNMTSIQDSTVRSLEEYKYINYGNYSTMMVGTSDEEILNSYIKFDLKKYPSTTVFLDSKLRIYYTAHMDENALELYALDREWDEGGVTYANRPLFADLVTDNYTINSSEKYVEFDVLNYIENVVNNGVENFGFGIRAKDGRSYSLFTRESSLKPNLSILYYDSRVLSTGRADLKATMFVIGAGNSDLHGFFNVKQHFDSNDLHGTLYVHRYEDPMNFDLTGTINIGIPELKSTLLVVQTDKNDCWSILTISKDIREDRLAYLNVNSPELVSSLHVSHHSNVDAYLNVRTLEKNEIESYIVASSPELVGTIYTVPTYDLHATITINQNEVAELESRLFVSRPELHGTLFAYMSGNSDLESHLSIRAYGEEEVEGFFNISIPEMQGSFITKVHSSIDSSMIISNPELNAIVAVRAIEDYDVRGTLLPRVLRASDLIATLNTTNRHRNGAYYFII